MRKPGSRVAVMFAALAVIACALAVLWLWAVPTALHSSTFAVIAAFAIGGTAVSLLTWRNAQATSTIAQVLHDTEMAGRRGPVSR